MYIEQGLRSGDRVFIRSSLEVIAGLLQNDANDDWVKTIGENVIWNLQRSDIIEIPFIDMIAGFLHSADLAVLSVIASSHTRSHILGKVILSGLETLYQTSRFSHLTTMIASSPRTIARLVSLLAFHYDSIPDYGE